MINIASLQNKIIDLSNDVYAQVSDHLCVVETWLQQNTDYQFNLPEKTFDHVPYGRGKGCGIFSKKSRILSQQKKKVAREKYQLMSIIDEANPISSISIDSCVCLKFLSFPRVGYRSPRNLANKHDNNCYW